MLSVGFEPAIAAFERTNTARALDRAANVIGVYIIRKLVLLNDHCIVCENY
jgi:hypothetical protein